MNKILALDRQWLIALNSHHTPWLDPVMYWASYTACWMPLYLVMLYLVIQTYKKQSWIVLVGVVLTILLADQVTSSLMKPYFARLRPSHEPSLQGMLHHVYGYTGGLYGFVSSHAANTFGTALFLSVMLRHKYRWIWVLFAWAVLVAYSRIYLGVHYPGDIAGGMVVGGVAALLGVLLSRYLLKRAKGNDIATG